MKHNRRIILVLLSLLGPMLSACQSTKTPRLLTMQLGQGRTFEDLQHFVSIVDLNVSNFSEMRARTLRAGPEYLDTEGLFDVRIDASAAKRAFNRTRIGCNGTRNIAKIGTGSKEQFFRLSKLANKWSLPELARLGYQSGISTSASQNYWAPAHMTCSPGLILAVRNFEAEEGAQVGGLVFVESISAKGSLRLFVFKNPNEDVVYPGE